jgi:hypothetical protein
MHFAEISRYHKLLKNGQVPGDLENFTLQRQFISITKLTLPQKNIMQSSTPNDRNCHHKEVTSCLGLLQNSNCHHEEVTSCLDLPQTKATANTAPIEQLAVRYRNTATCISRRRKLCLASRQMFATLGNFGSR